MTDRCLDCRFWKLDKRHSDDDDPAWSKGECCRHAPQPSHGQFEHQVLAHLSLLSYHLTDDPENWSTKWEEAVIEYSQWPLTWGGDWCGEFEPTRPQ